MIEYVSWFIIEWLIIIIIYQNRQRQSFDLWFPTSSLLEKSFSSIITSTTTWVKDDNWSAIIDDDIQYSVYFKNVNFMFFGGCVYQAFLWIEMFNVSFLDLLFFVWDRNCLKPEASNRYFKKSDKGEFFSIFATATCLLKAFPSCSSWQNVPWNFKYFLIQFQTVSCKMWNIWFLFGFYASVYV